MTFLDGLGSLPQLSAYSRDALQRLKDDALSKLLDLIPLDDHDTLFAFVPVYNPVTSIQFGSFAIPKGPTDTAIHTFNLQAPTTRDNAMRVVRACQVRKPILLEGSPGVGKTSLITALANISGHQLCRINLSDQTDLIDLFGSDLPVEGGGPGEFAWRDAEFLKALQEGHWVLLDEMNLAPQAVLEGLNAVLDHRGTVYIPELGRSFVRHPSFRIFAAQNPLNQGGGRKGLPKSFVNRFTKVYIEQLSPSDLLMVCQHVFPDLDEDIVRAMISFNMHLDHEVAIQRSFAREGTPWEFNLRDVIRWGTLLRTHDRPLHPVQHLRTVYLHRFRTENDRNQACLLFDKVFSMSMPSTNPNPYASISQSHVQIGDFTTSRKNLVPFSQAGRILKMQLSILESLGHCVLHSWLSILTGPRNSGKTEALRVLAHFTGNELREIPVNSATDTMDILGSFEQADMHKQTLNLVDEALALLEDQLRSLPGSNQYSKHAHNLRRARNGSVPPQSLLLMASQIVANIQHSSAKAVDLLGRIKFLLDAPEAVGRFEWVDGPLVQAMKLGHWLLLDGANLCNPSVLDRLNPLCEPDGFLTLSERGYDNGKLQVLKPHPNFRLFMTVDPQYGELSRAMRNRGIEIAFAAKPHADDLSILSDFRRLPSPLRHARYPYLTFDAVRRGLLSQADPELHLKSSTGRSLDQESGLSTLVDQAPMIVASSSKATGITDAHLFFFARTVAPAYLPQFNRFLASVLLTSDPSLHRLQALLNTFPGPSLIAGLKHFWEALSASLGLSFELLCTQVS
jgi:midasin